MSKRGRACQYSLLLSAEFCARRQTGQCSSFSAPSKRFPTVRRQLHVSFRDLLVAICDDGRFCALQLHRV